MAGHARFIVVRRVMTGVARQTRRAMSISPAYDHRPMGHHAIGLGRAVAHGMTIETARMLQHLAGLAEQRNRSCGLLRFSRLTKRASRRHTGRKSEKDHETSRHRLNLPTPALRHWSLTG